jgi:hypothetical protein
LNLDRAFAKTLQTRPPCRKGQLFDELRLQAAVS